MEKVMDKPKAYNKKEFVDVYSKGNDISKSLEVLIQDDTNPGAREDLGSILKNDSKAYSGISTDTIRSDASEVLGVWADGMARYVERNLGAFLYKLETEELYNVALTSHPYKTGNTSHDKTANLQLELARMQAIEKGIKQDRTTMSEEEKLGVMAEYIARRLQKDGDAGLLNSFLKYASGDTNYVKQTFNSYLQQTQRELQERFITNDKLDRGKIIRYIRNNLDKANEDSKKAGYLALAQQLYSKEK